MTASWRESIKAVAFDRAPRRLSAAVLSEVLTRWPTPADLARANRGQLTLLLRQLGFGQKRALRMVRLSALAVEGSRESSYNRPTGLQRSTKEVPTT